MIGTTTPICARWIPQVLTAEMKAGCVRVGQLWIEDCCADPDWLNNVITADESWMYACNPLLKRQSIKWRKKGVTPPLKVKVQTSATKVMAITFFDHCGMVYCHFVHPGHTVNAYYYIGVLEKLVRVHITCKCPEFQGGCFKLHHDNALVHNTKIVRTFLEKKKSK